MKILIAPDKFKGTLTASEVCETISEGLRSKNVETECTPLADGGEGTFDVLTQAANCRIKKVKVSDPLMRPIVAAYGITPDGETAFIEMASASGLQLLLENERNPSNTTSYGTGELIVDALNEKVKKIVLGIGGSATTDAGIGMMAALGVQFQTETVSALPAIGKSLNKIKHISATRLHPRAKETEFVILCDVSNPLYGPHGAAHVYAPQKGANEEDVVELDRGLRNFSELAAAAFQTNVNFEGAGAAGGIGASAKLFLSASFKKGIEFVADVVDLEEKIASSDFVITGEGKVDEQTFSGKVVAHVIHLAQKHRKPVVIACGQCTVSSSELAKLGVIEIIQLAATPGEVQNAQRNAHSLLRKKISELNFLKR